MPRLASCFFGFPAFARGSSCTFSSLDRSGDVFSPIFDASFLGVFVDREDWRDTSSSGMPELGSSPSWLSRMNAGRSSGGHRL